MRLLLLISFTFLCGVCAAQSDDVYRSSDSSSEDAFVDERSDPYLRMMLSLPLNAEQNPFEEASRYGFTAVRYMRRGYDYSLSNFSINGLSLNDAVSDGVYWDVVRGLGDMSSMAVESFGATSRGEGVKSISESTDYLLSSDLLVPQRRVGYILTDRSFRSGVRAQYFGEGSSGLYYALSASMRTGDDSHIEGYYREDYRFNALLGRKGDKSDLSLFASAAPITQSLRSANTEECFELTGDNLYNSYWGYDDEQVRSSRVRDDFVPLVGASYDYTLSNRLKVGLSVGSMFGYTSTSRLGWSGVSNPTPDYSSYMPSGLDNPDVADIVEAAWRDRDAAFTQISWDDLYSANRGDGVSPANYYIESDVRSLVDFQGATNISYRGENGVRVSGGLNINIEDSRYYKILDDDLGGLFIYDNDPFVAIYSDYSDLSANDTQSVGEKIEVGDEFGYNYSIEYRRYGGWFSAGYDSGLYSLSADLSCYENRFVRIGYYDKALYDSSLTVGRSREYSFAEVDLSLSGRLTLSSYSHLEAMVSIGQNAPSVDEIFFDVRYSEVAPDNVTGAQYASFELVYRYLSDIDLFASIYGTALRSESKTCSYYDDLRGEYLHAAYGDISQNFVGIELGARVPVVEDVDLLLGAAYAYNYYVRDISATVQSFITGEIVASHQISRVSGLRVEGSPQSVATAHLQYSCSGLFSVDFGGSFMTDNYISIDPLRRRDSVLDVAASPEAYDELMEQEMLPAALVFDLSLSKSFRIRDSYLSFYLMISNLFDNQNIVYRGYEQSRLTETGTDVNSSWSASESKYYNGYGRTLYMSVNYKF